MKCAIFEEHSSSCVVYSRFSGTLFPVSMIDGVNAACRAGVIICDKNTFLIDLCEVLIQLVCSQRRRNADSEC